MITQNTPSNSLLESSSVPSSAETFGHWIDTPEGVRLPLVAAGLLPRAMALAVDWLVIAGFFWLLSMLLGSAMRMQNNQGLVGLALVLVFLIVWGYHIVCEVTWGATVGKRVLKLHVVQVNGAPVHWQSSVIRNLLRVADSLPMFYLLGGAVVLQSRRSQRLGDILAGTVVAHRVQHHHTLELTHALDGVLAQELPIFSGYALSLSERQILLHFAERQADLSIERRNELAQELAFLVDIPERVHEDDQAEFVRQTLLRYAQYIMSGAKL